MKPFVRRNKTDTRDAAAICVAVGRPDIRFVAIKSVEQQAARGLDDEHEDIRVLVASPEDVWRWIDQGRIVNGPALVGLQWFRVHQQRLRNRPPCLP